MAYQLGDAKQLINDLNAGGAKIPNTPQMQLAVLSWLRQENGAVGPGTNNNPLGVTSGGSFVHFTSESAGLQGAANNLLHGAASGSFGYDTVIQAGRSGQPDIFLSALARSSWDGSRYGLKNIDYATGGASGTNHLISVYNGLASSYGYAHIADIPVPRGYKSGDPIITLTGASGPGSGTAATTSSSGSNSSSSEAIKTTPVDPAKWSNWLRSEGVVGADKPTTSQLQDLALAVGLTDASGIQAFTSFFQDSPSWNDVQSKLNSGNISININPDFNPLDAVGGTLGAVGQQLADTFTWIGFILIGLIIFIAGTILIVKLPPKEQT